MIGFKIPNEALACNKLRIKVKEFEMLKNTFF